MTGIVTVVWNVPNWTVRALSLRWPGPVTKKNPERANRSQLGKSQGKERMIRNRYYKIFQQTQTASVLLKVISK
jgi:hypothetical protein